MDRFVTRAPTWKTLNYSSMAAKSSNKRTSTQPVDNKKKPLQQKQMSEVTKSYDFDKRLDDLLRPNQANAENFNGNSNDSGLSSASSVSPQQFEENAPPRCDASPSKVYSTPTKTKGKLDDYIDGPIEKENETFVNLSQSPKSHKKVAECVKLYEKTIQLSKNLTPLKSSSSSYATPDKLRQQQATNSNMIMARIQRDLNSPSAAARVKALKAMKSPTKSAYAHFDIPEAEQSLHLPELPSLQEIMRNIVVYVEVRSGEDNRSAGVRKVIEALGARVNLSLVRGTTHVVFKDGLMSTFKKATQMGIPIVSILWIEACKNQGRICDPKNYPISNLDRYENPELYSKMKRVKSMQPDSECNKRIRAKGGGGGTPKDTTPTQKTGAAGAIKKTSTLIGGTPTSSTNKKKTDISQFFKKLEKPTAAAAVAGGGGGDTFNGSTTVLESPATQLLNRINSECYTPLEHLKNKTAKKIDNIEIYDEESLEGFGTVGGNSPKPRNSVKKALDFQQIEEKQNVPNNFTPINTRRRRSIAAAVTTPQATVEIEASVTVNIQHRVTPSPLKKTKPPRRHSLMPVGEIETATRSLNTMAICNTPSRNTRRRSSIHAPRDMTMETPTKQLNIQPSIVEESNELETMEQEKVEKPIAPPKPPRSVNKRRTLYAVKTMEQTDLIQTIVDKTQEVEKQPAAATKTTRRRTSLNTKTLDISEVHPVSNGGTASSNVNTRRRTCYSLKSIERTEIVEEEAEVVKTNDKLTNDEHSEGADIANNNSNEKNRKEFTNKVMELLKGIDVVAKTPPPSAAPPPTKNNTKSQRRRTLYTPQKLNDISSVSSTNFTPGNVACSTLLEDEANKTKLVATPPADAVTGKILEETAECATPIVFSSTRLPGNKRRTIFDVSMDIITQRLQCINQSARKSLAPPATPLAEVAGGEAGGINKDAANLLNTPMDWKKSKQLENICKTPTTSSSSDAINPTNEKDNDATKAAAAAVINTPEVALKKKRKLFMPNEMLLTPPPAPIETNKAITKSTPTAAATNSVTKRRRTLMPISQPQLSTVTFKDSTANTTPGIKKRRSTLDFEQIQNTKTNNNNINAIDKYGKTQEAPSSSSSLASSSSITKESTANTESKTKKMPVLVYTNMHHQQIDVIREAINNLGTFTLESCVTDSTTHLVSLEPRRTLNLLRALVRGLWILEYSWIEDSLLAGKWLPEEPYELRDFSRSIEICRSERQAFGEHYKCELFRKFGSFYVSSQCSPITKENLCELIRLCGGRVLPSRQKARYIIGDSNRNLEDKFYLTPYWVLDSITQMQIMKINHKYTYPLPDGEIPATQLLGVKNNNKT